MYVSNVLSGTVTRLDLSIAGEDGAARSIQVTAATQIASGYITDPNALVIGPTGLAVEFNTDGHFVAQFQLDMGAGGGAFGLAFGQAADRMQFAAVDDDQNTLNIWTLR